VNPTHRTKRPLGINLVVAFYVTKVIFYVERTLVRLDYRFYRFILDHAGIRDFVIAMLSLFIVIGLTGMRRWGRILAIIVSGALAIWWGGFYILDIAMGLWTLLPEGLWNNTEVIAVVVFEVTVVWYLSRSETRGMFRAPQNPPVAGAGEIVR
jgi:hypothetical protein